MLLISSFLAWLILHSVYHNVHFLSPIFFVFLGELSDPHYKSLHILSLTYVLFFVGSFRPGTISPYVFFLILDVTLLITRSCLLSVAILSKNKIPVSTQCKMYLQILLRFYLLSSCKITILMVYIRTELNFLGHILYQSNVINLIVHVSILDVVTLGNSFLGLIINSNGLWSLLKRNFFPVKNSRALVVVHTMAHSSFSIFE